MLNVFYIAAAAAVISTGLVIVQVNVVHALLYLILSLLSVAVIFFTLGAPFAAALEIIIYAGAIMILFVFVIMMLNLGSQSVRTERSWLRGRMWTGPVLIAAILLADVICMFHMSPGAAVSYNLRPGYGAHVAGPKAVGIALFGPYLIGVELSSILLLAGLVGAYHLGRRQARAVPTEGDRREGEVK